jgi:DNA-binding LacI/PurR family transcriptional regulator
MTDIAELAGVSRMAVSAVLMGTGGGRIRVAEETATRIRRIADEIGYRPNLAARQLAGQRSGMIGIVASDWGNFLTQRALSWLHAAAEQRDLRVVATYARHSIEPVERAIRDLKSGWLDGLVYLAHENQAQWPEVRRLLEGIRNVVVAVGDLGAPGIPAVVSDVHDAARSSVDHLVARGRRRILLVTEEVDSSALRTRIKAYRAGCAAHGLAFDDTHVIVETKGWSISRAELYPKFDTLARTLVDVHRADAILCDTDFTAAGLLKSLRRLGIRVPQDVSVVGWGDLQFAEIFDPMITSASLDLPDLLTRVVDRLQRSTDEPSGPEVERIPMKLLVRESS